VRALWVGLVLVLALVGPARAQDAPKPPSGEITELERLRETVELLRARGRQDENQAAMLRAYIRQLEQHSAELHTLLQKLAPAPTPKSP